MKRLALATSILLSACISADVSAQSITDTEWQLLAIDGQITDMPAMLVFDTSGRVSGRAPCNRWFASNTATLPAVALSPIGATKMACDRLADEQTFFDALAGMQSAALDGDRNLILSGPDGRSMEFVPDLADGQTVCKTCAP